MSFVFLLLSKFYVNYECVQGDAVSAISLASLLTKIEQR